ncbi:MAG: JmjC domain-containing protein [Inquilinaceae bacterium]
MTEVPASTLLGGMPIARFLDDYWQRRPLLVRGAIPDFSGPITPDELAGLACEEAVESRLVIRDGLMPWETRDGPFDQAAFADLPKSGWTLLVQSVDHWFPPVADLLDRFDFLPSWRLDDIMVSYAADGGGVGPHYDAYDVFLLQGQGRRRWRVGPACGPDIPLRPHPALRLLDDFPAEHDWVLEHGDMLYLPPGFAHDGVAIGDSMTYSIGFRAPSHGEILTGAADAVAEPLDETRRYADAAINPAENPGRIGEDVIAALRNLVLTHMDDPDRLARWFAATVTEPKDQTPAPNRKMSARRMASRLAADPLRRTEASRFAFLDRPGGILLFVDGLPHECRGPSADLGRLLCARRRFEPRDLAPYLTDPDCIALLCALYAGGSLYWP